MGSMTVSAQFTDKEKADQAYESLKFQDAIKYYKLYLEKEDDPAATLKLAEAYYLNGEYGNSESILEVLHSDNNLGGKDMLKYANILFLNGKKSEAKSILAVYIEKNPSTDEYKRLFQSANLTEKEAPTTYKYEVSISPFNSEVSDFSPMYYGDKLLFTSQKGGKKDPWTGRSFANIYVTNPSMSQAEMLTGNLNGKFHNGAITFVKDNTMIFTRNNGKKGSNQDYNLILAVAEKNGDKWNYKQEFEFNDKDFSNAYPTYLANEKTLIFSSDRPGGFGGMDLYATKYNGNNWSQPVNLGKDINTNNDEVFSYTDGIYLYFASNGYPGLGGLDIFKTPFSNGKIGEIIHLDAPINSNRDDFGLITKDDLTSGYFASNREGNGSIDNIYSFEKIKIDLPPQDITISGKVIDEYTKIPLKETEVIMTNVIDGTTQKVITGDDGRFSFTALSKQDYEINGHKNGIQTTSALITSTNTDDSYYYTLLHNDPRFSLEGFAINNKTEIGVQGVTIICFNKTTLEEKTAVTDEKGFFKFQLDQDADFEISGTKNSYYTSVSEASTKGLNRSTTLYVKLFLSVEEVIIGDTKILGKETFGGFDFDPVYYDLDKANIRSDAALALDKVVIFLEKNPTLQIELGSHTDCRATDQYNQELSQRRAQSAVTYIIQKGINATRIVAKGYGESRLVNGCYDGVKCSEDEHQLNRRTEIKVVGVDQ